MLLLDSTVRTSLNNSFFPCFKNQDVLTSQGHLMPGLWTEPVILSSSESWMHFMVTKHPGAALFMFLDVFLLTGALILTGAQAVQVSCLIEKR